MNSTPNFDNLLLQTLMGRLQIRQPNSVHSPPFLNQTLEDLLLDSINLSDNEDDADDNKTQLAKEESKLEKDIIRTILTGKTQTLKPNSGQAVTIGEHHICVGFHEETESDYRVWEWHGHIMLFDEENGYTPGTSKTQPHFSLAVSSGQMEFWGVEVKSSELLVVDPGEGMVLHLSQACLGELKKDKGNESVCLFVNVDGKKLVLGTLSHEKLPQQQFDLVFDRQFELSHNLKNGSVYFYGYKANNPFEESEDESDFDDEELPLQAVNNGKQETQVKQEKPSASEKAKDVKGKQKVKIVEPSKDVKPDDDEDSDDESDDLMSDDESDSEEDGEGSSDDDDDSDEEDDETPKNAQPSKKRPMDSATKTPGPDKKAKLVTPQKTDGKKGGGHVATPHPSKQTGKTPATIKSNQQTPKSDGSHTCNSCKRTFKTENALDSHSKAKHSAAK